MPAGQGLIDLEQARADCNGDEQNDRKYNGQHQLVDEQATCRLAIPVAEVSEGGLMTTKGLPCSANQTCDRPQADHGAANHGDNHQQDGAWIEA